VKHLSASDAACVAGEEDALSWMISAGHADSLDLARRAWSWSAPATTTSPAHRGRSLGFVDESATPAQQTALADIFLGPAGGSPEFWISPSRPLILKSRHWVGSPAPWAVAGTSH
jgi:hypothetical protein